MRVTSILNIEIRHRNMYTLKILDKLLLIIFISDILSKKYIVANNLLYIVHHNVFNGYNTSKKEEVG